VPVAFNVGSILVLGSAAAMITDFEALAAPQALVFFFAENPLLTFVVISVVLMAGMSLAFVRIAPCKRFPTVCML
jgi:hypothetical protein